MSNITSDASYYTTEFIKTELMSNEAANKSQFEKGCAGVTDKSKSFHKEIDHSCFYNTSSSVPKTILITNNYSQDDASGLKNVQNIQKSSSITIVTHNSDGDRSTSSIPTSANSSTVVLDRINICINNHFNDARSNGVTNVSSAPNQVEKGFSKEPKLVKEEPMNECVSSTNNILTADDSTMLQKPDTKVPIFTIGEDVLVQRKDGRFYLGTIITVARNQCLVRLDDNSEYWSLFEEITKLSTADSNDEPMCVVCKKVNEKDIVEVCERCGRGYHQGCTEERFQKNGVWFCRRCTARNGLKLRQCPSPRIEPLSKILTDKSQLPYDIDSLTWDNHHRVNLEQIYCYCGGNGEWHKKMLQCCKCQQWFHEKCVRCLDYPLYRGDRFFVFVCSMCNHGVEFLRRLVMKWIDVVHLLLFNITSYNQQKYYHANQVFVPYAIDNWPFLHLDVNMRNLTANEIKDNILSTLTINSPRFKCGRETKKQQSVWGLRNRIPPPAPILIIPPEDDVNEHYLRHRAKLNFISNESPIEIPKDIEFKMSGVEYLGENSDNESSEGISDIKFTSDDELPLKVTIELDNKQDITIDACEDQQLSIAVKEINREASPNVVPEEDSLGNGHSSTTTDSSEKSHDCPEYNNGTDDADIEMKDDETLDGTIQRTKRNRKRKSPFLPSLTLTCTENTTKTHADVIDICDSSDDTSSRGTLDLIIPPPVNFQGRNNPFRTTPKKNDNNIETSSSLVALKNSISEGSSSSSTGSGNNKNTKPVKPPVLNSKLFGNVDLNQVANQFRIVRTVKRRLSAKDIMIGPNKEVKRRRLRRRSGNVEVISTTTIQTLPKSAAYLPIRSDNKDWPVSAIRSTLVSANSSSSSSTPHTTSPTNLGSITNVFNGRRLRQRQGKNYAESSRRNSTTNLTAPSSSSVTNTSSLPGSPNKSSNQSNLSLSDLKSSVNMYFGAAHRIESGEKFLVRAKRCTTNGKTQYLIEWEGI